MKRKGDNSREWRRDDGLVIRISHDAQLSSFFLEVRWE
jgi:hypothetical protein